MHTNSFLAVLFVWMPFLWSSGLSQCPELIESEIKIVTLAQAKRDDSEGGDIQSVIINDFNINCLAVAPTRGYEEATATVNYTTNTGETNAFQLVLDCPSQDWRSLQSVRLPRTVGSTEVTEEELLNSETDINCISCSPGPSPSFCTGSTFLGGIFLTGLSFMPHHMHEMDGSLCLA